MDHVTDTALPLNQPHQDQVFLLSLVLVLASQVARLVYADDLAFVWGRECRGQDVGYATDD